MDDAPKTLLVTLTGKDRPGVTSAVFATLAAAGVEVLDIEQIVLRRRLVLGVLVTAPARLEEAARRHRAHRRRPGHDRRGRPGRRATTGRARAVAPTSPLIGSPLKASAMSAIAGRIADSGANIDRIERMARYPVTAIELHVSGAPARDAATAARGRGGHSRASTSPCSASQPAPPRRAADRDGRRLDAHPGRGDRDDRGPRRRARTRSRASPRPPCAASSTSRRRCASGSPCSKGVPASVLDEVYDAIVLAPGRARWCGPCSGSATASPSSPAASARSPTGWPRTSASTSPAANELEIVDGRLTGESSGRSSTAPARPRPCASSPRRSGSRWTRHRDR